MTINSENLVLRAWFMMHRSHDILKRCEDKVFGEYNLTAEQYAMLTAIKYLNEPVRVTDIARRLTRSVNSISMLVDRMVKADLIRRVRDVKDRRTVHVSTTSKGETLLEPATLAGREFIQKTLSELSYEDKQTLVRLLETLEHEASEYLNKKNEQY